MLVKGKANNEVVNHSQMTYMHNNTCMIQPYAFTLPCEFSVGD